MKNKKSNEPRNYIAGPDSLQTQTYNFRSSLKEWRNEQGETKTVLIDGADKPLLMASYAEILRYFKEYTEQWMLADTKSKEDFKHVWFIDCRGLYVTFSPPNLSDAEQNIKFLAPVQFDYSTISGNFYLFVGKKFLGEASFFKVRWDCVEWLISWLYDFISEYGSSPVRPLCSVVVVNIVVFCIFYVAFLFGDCHNSDFCLLKDASMFAQQHPVFYLTLQNLISSSVVKAGIFVNNQYMIFLGVLQYVFTYLILILSALAIKNRFQKGGG